MSYLVKEIFWTLQGEGTHAGTPAVFIRFAGCNVWTGVEANRGRDAAKGGCALWCDTDFNGGTRMDAPRIAQAAKEAAGACWHQGVLVVLTGGEPGLQVDDAMVDALHAAGAFIAVETNGSRLLPSGIDWVCVSPKPPMRVVLEQANEVKVIMPAFDPAQYAHLSGVRWVQPQDTGNAVGNRLNVSAAVDFVQANPGWKLSTQTHKILGLR